MVWEGLGSCLFRVVFLDQYFWSTFSGILSICWASGSPWWSKWVSSGDLEGPNSCAISDPGGTMVPRWLPGSKKESFLVTSGCLLEVI